MTKSGETGGGVERSLEAIVEAHTPHEKSLSVEESREAYNENAAREAFGDEFIDGLKNNQEKFKGDWWHLALLARNLEEDKGRPGIKGEERLGVWNAWRRRCEESEDSPCEWAHLERANLESARLEHAKLDGAHLEYTLLNEVVLSHADLSGAHLNDSHLNNANLEHTSLVGAHLKGAELGESRLLHAKLRGADLGKVKLVSGQLMHADFTGVDLSGARLNNADLSDANLNDCKLRGTQLVDATLRNAKLLRVSVDSTTSFGQTPIVDGCVIERYTLDSLNEGYGGLDRGRRMLMEIKDDVATLRTQYSGFLMWIHLLALASFMFPYVWFAGKQYMNARFGLFGDAEGGIELYKAIALYIWTGAVNWKEGVFNLVPFVLFTGSVFYNVFRFILLWKTKMLELEQEVRGLPVRFSLVGSWRRCYQISRWGFWVYLFVVAVHSFYFLTQRVPL